MNLCSDPWIPVRWQDSRQSRVGLRTLLERSSEIADLVLAPHERISVMRLLVCIVQRAINGPETVEDREECRDEIVPKSLAYLDRWHSAFELIGENGAFLQFANVEPNKEGRYTPLSKLNMTKASGNNPTLFDNGDYRADAVDLGRLAIDLLTYQNFSVCGKIGIARWNGVLTSPQAPDTVSAAPCVCSSAIHLILKGPNLLDTLAMNLIPFNAVCPALRGIGVPVWEKMPVSASDTEAVANASLTYLGRLVPVSRCVKLLPDLDGCVNAKGVEYPTWVDSQLVYYEHTMTLMRIEKDNKMVAVRANPGKSLWRSLPSLLHRFRKNYVLPAVLDNDAMPDQLDVWIGAMIADQAKIIDILEDSFAHMAPGSVEGPQFEVMVDLMKKAEAAAFGLKGAVKTYLAGMTDAVKMAPDLPAHAEGNYWMTLTRHKELLVELARKSAEGGTAAAANKWLECVVACARDAYESVTMKNTPRQLRAWANARQFLPSIKSLSL